MYWTPERSDALEQMWLWGISSGSIASNLGGMTRNAVMGRLNRAGLMGRGGERLGAEINGAKVDKQALKDVVAELLHEDYDGRKAVHWHALVAVTSLLVGHRENVLAHALEVNIEAIRHSLDSMHQTGVWKREEHPPSAWWHHEEGWMAFMLDMMTAGGMISIATTDTNGSRTYTRPPERRTDSRT